MITPLAFIKHVSRFRPISSALGTVLLLQKRTVQIRLRRSIEMNSDNDGTFTWKVRRYKIPQPHLIRLGKDRRKKAGYTQNEHICTAF